MEKSLNAEQCKAVTKLLVNLDEKGITLSNSYEHQNKILTERLNKINKLKSKIDSGEDEEESKDKVSNHILIGIPTQPRAL